MRQSVGVFDAFTYSVFVSGSQAPPPQPMPPIDPGTVIVPCIDGGVYSGPILYRDATARAESRITGVKSMTSSSVKPCGTTDAGFVGKGCVGHASSPGTSLGGTAFSSIGHNGSPFTRLNAKRKPCLVGTITASTGPDERRIVTTLGGAGRS